MEIKYHPLQDVLEDQVLWDGCLHLANQAIEQGSLDSRLFGGDAGTYTAAENGEIVGYVSLSQDCTDELGEWWVPGSTMYVEQVVVDDGWRGHGIMRSMYERIFDYFDGWTFMASVSEDNETSFQAHLSLGFETAGWHGKYRVMVR